jgi:hypothetical protein
MPAWQIASVIGFVVGVPALVWTLTDLRRIPMPIWDRSPYSRGLWSSVVVVGYLLGGWLAVVIAAAWRWSRDRADLVDDCHVLAPAEHGADLR